MEKISVITGGANGLGLCIAKRLVADNKKVLIIDKTDSVKLKNFISKNNNMVMFYNCDVSDDKSLKQIAKQIAGKYKIEYLINNAGVIKVGDFKDNNLSTIKPVFDSTVIGTMLVVRNFLPILKQANEGKVIVVNSSAGLMGKAQESVYCSAKFAQKGYLLALKEELKNTNIKVLGCYPGGMNTGFYDNIRHYAPIEKTNTFMKPEKVADVICENIYAADSLNITEIIIERV